MHWKFVIIETLLRCVTILGCLLSCISYVACGKYIDKKYMKFFLIKQLPQNRMCLYKNILRLAIYVNVDGNISKDLKK